MAHYKKTEFKQFLKTIKRGQASHWVDIAEALGVDKNTISDWKKTPEAQQAIQEGIEFALECMQQAGARDWRMWETKLKMLGINPASKVEVQMADPLDKILGKFGIEGDDAGKTEEA